jgi:hypothetical protein
MLGLSVKDASSIFMMVIFVASFLALFFFVYATKVEEQVVEHQVDFIVNDLISPTRMLSKEQSKYLRAAIQLIDPPDMSKEDNEVVEHNKKVFTDAIKIIIIFVVVGIAIIYFLAKKYNFSFKEILKNNLIVLCFVGITEYIFLTYIGSAFYSANPYYVKKLIVDKLSSLS